MQLQDLKIEIDKLEKEFDLKKDNLIKKYCDANNPYKVGDKFTDHMGTILIEKILYYTSTSFQFCLPCCVYFGTELKKDGTPKKNGAKRRASQSNDINEEARRLFYKHHNDSIKLI